MKKLINNKYRLIHFIFLILFTPLETFSLPGDFESEWVHSPSIESSRDQQHQGCPPKLHAGTAIRLKQMVEEGMVPDSLKDMDSFCKQIHEPVKPDDLNLIKNLFEEEATLLKQDLFRDWVDEYKDFILAKKIKINRLIQHKNSSSTTPNQKRKIEKTIESLDNACKIHPSKGLYVGEISNYSCTNKQLENFEKKYFKGKNSNEGEYEIFQEYSKNISESIDNKKNERDKEQSKVDQKGFMRLDFFKDPNINKNTDDYYGNLGTHRTDEILGPVSNDIESMTAQVQKKNPFQILEECTHIRRSFNRMCSTFAEPIEKVFASNKDQTMSILRNRAFNRNNLPKETRIKLKGLFDQFSCKIFSENHKNLTGMDKEVSDRMSHAIARLVHIYDPKTSELSKYHKLLDDYHEVQCRYSDKQDCEDPLKEAGKDWLPPRSKSGPGFFPKWMSSLPYSQLPPSARSQFPNAPGTPNLSGGGQPSSSAPSSGPLKDFSGPRSYVAPPSSKSASVPTRSNSNRQYTSPSSSTSRPLGANSYSSTDTNQMAKQDQRPPNQASGNNASTSNTKIEKASRTTGTQSIAQTKATQWINERAKRAQEMQQTKSSSTTQTKSRTAPNNAKTEEKIINPLPTSSQSTAKSHSNSSDKKFIPSARFSKATTPRKYSTVSNNATDDANFENFSNKYITAADVMNYKSIRFDLSVEDFSNMQSNCKDWVGKDEQIECLFDEIRGTYPNYDWEDKDIFIKEKNKVYAVKFIYNPETKKLEKIERREITSKNDNKDLLKAKLSLDFPPPTKSLWDVKAPKILNGKDHTKLRTKDLYDTFNAILKSENKSIYVRSKNLNNLLDVE